MTDETPINWLTQEAFDRLSAELAERSGPRRADITAKIEAAREEGDLKENGGYHAAKEEQGKNEARIVQLRHLLDHSEIGSLQEAAEGKATHGTVVTIRFEGDTATESFLLASREEAAHATISVYSPSSPLGEAVLGAEPGDTVTYQLPNGRSISVEVIKVEPYGG